MNRGSTDRGDWYKAEHNHKNRSPLLLTIAVVIGIIFLITFLRPSLIGYSIYQDVQKTNYSLNEYGESVHNLKTELAITQANKTVYADLTNRLEQNIEEKESQLETCRTEKTALQANFESIQITANVQTTLFESAIQEKEETITDLKKESTDFKEKLKDDLADQKMDLQRQCQEGNADVTQQLAVIRALYNSFVANQAKSVCCKERVDNPDIQFYDVLNDKLLCLEEGTKKLEC